MNTYSIMENILTASSARQIAIIGLALSFIALVVLLFLGQWFWSVVPVMLIAAFVVIIVALNECLLGEKWTESGVQAMKDIGEEFHL